MIDYSLSGCVALITGANNPQGFRRRKTDKNSADLNSAWATVCNRAAVNANGVPIPIRATRYPNCDMVEYAKSSFRS